MVGFLTFLAGPIGRWLVVGVIVAAFLAGLHHRVKQKGWDERDAIAQKADAARDKAEAEAAERWVKRLTDYRDALDLQIAAAAKKQKALEDQLRSLRQQLQDRVPEYVTKESDKRIADCGGVPVGFVRHHDHSAAGPSAGPLPPAPEGGVVDRDSGIALSVVASTVSFNYAQFHRCITSLRAWESWYPSVKGIYDSRLGSPAPAE